MRGADKRTKTLGLVTCAAVAACLATAESAVGTTGSYKGFTVTAVVKGKQDSFNSVTTHSPSNHLMMVELKFARDASAPGDLKTEDRFAAIPTKEIELHAAGTVYHPGLAGPAFRGIGLGIAFDKSLATGTVTFFVEVPKETVCSEITMKLADSAFRFEQAKFPKSCH